MHLLSNKYLPTYFYFLNYSFTETVNAVNIMFMCVFNIQIVTVILISGSLIYRLRGVDPDGDTLQFGIRDQLGSDILRLEAISSNEANIYLVKELDREVSYFIFVKHW